MKSEYPIVNDALRYLDQSLFGKSHKTRESNRRQLQAALDAMTSEAKEDYRLRASILHHRGVL